MSDSEGRLSSEKDSTLDLVDFQACHHHLQHFTMMEVEDNETIVRVSLAHITFDGISGALTVYPDQGCYTSIYGHHTGMGARAQDPNYCAMV